MDNAAPWLGLARSGVLDNVKGAPDPARLTRTVAIDPEETCHQLLQVLRNNNGAAVFDFESWRVNSPPLAAFHCKANVSAPHGSGALHGSPD